MWIISIEGNANKKGSNKTLRRKKRKFQESEIEENILFRFQFSFAWACEVLFTLNPWECVGIILAAKYEVRLAFHGAKSKARFSALMVVALMGVSSNLVQEFNISFANSWNKCVLCVAILRFHSVVNITRLKSRQFTFIRYARVFSGYNNIILFCQYVLHRWFFQEPPVAIEPKSAWLHFKFLYFQGGMMDKVMRRSESPRI